MEKLSVKILGSGCAKCEKLEKETKKALVDLQLDANIDHVRDFGKISEYGVMTTPALVVNEKVLFSGKVMKAKHISKMLEEMTKV